MAADETEALGLRLSNLTEESQRKFQELKERRIIPPIAATGNPIDLTGSATDDSFVESMRILLEDENVDGIIVLALHHVPGVSAELPSKLARLAKEYDKPVVAMDVGSSQYAREFRELFEREGIPAYPESERAVRAMKALVEFGRAKNLPR